MLLQENQPPSLILIIDDSISSIRLLTSMLKDKGEILFATSGDSGIQLALERQPHLILLDVDMPNMDGYEVCRRLKADPVTQDCAVIFVTGHGNSENEVRALEAGAVDFIAKPFIPQVVQMRVKTHLTIKHQTDRLVWLATRDPIADVFNRRYFNQQFELECQRHQRHGIPLGVALIDIDAFRLFNEKYGHEAGDECFRRLAKVISDSTRRPGEVLARFGSDEFGVILPNTTPDEAQRYAGWICESVRERALPHTHTPAGIVTVSVGAVSVIPTPHLTPAQLLEAANQALYQAKASDPTPFAGELTDNFSSPV